MKDEQIIKCGSKLILQEIDALKQMSESLDESFVQAVGLVSECKGKVVLSGMGKSGHIAKKIAATFSSIGVPSIFLHPAEASHGDMGVISYGDILIVLSNGGESQEIYDLLDFGNHNSNKIIAIVGNVNSTLYKKSDVQIKIPLLKEGTAVKAPMVSTVLMLSCGDAIAAALIDKNKITNNEFKKYHPGGKIGATLLKVSDIMRTSRHLPMVSEDQLMSEALIEMSEKSLGCTAVLNHNREFSGIITDGDLRRHMSPKLSSMKASDVMTRNPKTASLDLLVVDALKLMNDMKITSLFVISQNNTLLGVVHMHDCIRMGLKQADEE